MNDDIEQSEIIEVSYSEGLKKSVIAALQTVYDPEMVNQIFKMEDHIKELESENEKLKNILRNAFPEKSGHFFICGEAGEKDTSGLPDKVFICPTYGLDGFQVYKKDGKYSTPGW